MFDGKKALTISTLVVSALVLIWGAYTFFNNGILSPSKGEDVSTTVQNSSKSQTQNQKSTETSSEEDKENDKAKDSTSSSSSDKSTDKSTDSSSKQTDSKSSSTDANSDSKVEYVEYTIESGDTLSSIIKEIAKGYTFKEALELIAEKNKLENPNSITAGQKIYVPVMKVADKDKYTVKPGDTLTTIAKKLFPKEKIADAIKLIMEKNDMKDADSITVGQIILIPEVKEN